MFDEDIYSYLSKRVECDFQKGTMKWLFNPSQKRNWNQRMVGKPVGTNDGRGYKKLKIYFHGTKKMVFVHRLMFYMYHEYLPKQVDHFDRNRSNNRISNLRDCDFADNSYNKSLSKLNTSGFKGVCWHKKAGKWVARLGYQGRRISLGLFNSPEDAFNALEVARKKLHGGFATTGI